MNPSPQPDAGGQHDVLLLELARQLRDAARGANRTDVATRAEEIIAILAPATTGQPDTTRQATTGQPGDGRRQDGTAADRRGNTFIQVLDGLGL